MPTGVMSSAARSSANMNSSTTMRAGRAGSVRLNCDTVGSSASGRQTADGSPAWAAGANASAPATSAANAATAASGRAARAPRIGRLGDGKRPARVTGAAGVKTSPAPHPPPASPERAPPSGRRSATGRIAPRAAPTRSMRGVLLRERVVAHRQQQRTASTQLVFSGNFIAQAAHAARAERIGQPRRARLHAAHRQPQRVRLAARIDGAEQPGGVGPARGACAHCSNR